MANKPTILIIDDDPNFREIFSMKLGGEGCSVEVAENGTDGIKKAKNLKPDLVLMDVRLPGMDGVETMMKIRENPETKNTKVVFLTSLGDADTRMQDMNSRFSKEIGAAGYIKKTDDLEVITSKVKSFL